MAKAARSRKRSPRARRAPRKAKIEGNQVAAPLPLSDMSTVASESAARDEIYLRQECLRMALGTDLHKSHPHYDIIALADRFFAYIMGGPGPVDDAPKPAELSVFGHPIAAEGPIDKMPFPTPPAEPEEPFRSNKEFSF